MNKLRQLLYALGATLLLACSTSSIANAQGIEFRIDGQLAGNWNYPDPSEPYPIDLYIYPDPAGLYNFSTNFMLSDQFEVVSAEDLLDPEREPVIFPAGDNFTSVLFPVVASGECRAFTVEPYHVARIMVRQVEACGVFYTESATLLEPDFGVDIVLCPGTTTVVAESSFFSVGCPDPIDMGSWGVLKAFTQN